jgi:plasmid stabilization system protein ParE
MDKLRIHDDARAEYIESYVWYHERGSHIAEAFEREVEHALEALQESPDRWSVYVGMWRRILLRRFPFGIVYGALDNQIVVVAIMHTRRKPGYWKNRMFDVLPNKE